MLPGSAAQTVPDAPSFAVVEQDGVRLAASGDDWSVQPVSFSNRLTPVRVRIINHSSRALQILYSRFLLAGARGRFYPPLPPLRLFHERPHDADGMVHPYFASAGFFVRPIYGCISLTTGMADSHAGRRPIQPATVQVVGSQSADARDAAHGIARGGTRRRWADIRLPFLRERNGPREQAPLQSGSQGRGGSDTVTSISIPFLVE